MALEDRGLDIVLEEDAIRHACETWRRGQKIAHYRFVMFLSDQRIDLAPQTGRGVARHRQRHGVCNTLQQLRNDRQRPSPRRGVLLKNVPAGVLGAARRTLEIARVVQRREVNLMPFVQFTQNAEGANLGAAIGRMQEKWTYPENFHG